MQNWWEQDPTKDQVSNPYQITQPQTPSQIQQQQATGVQMQRTQQEIASQPLQNQNTQANINQSNASIGNMRFNQGQGLRQEFDALPEVKNYSVALSSLGTALKAPDSPQGDLALIYAYAKAADPGSVVREGEMDMAKATASLPQQFQAYAQGVTQGKRLPPSVRTGLIEAMRQSVSGLRQAYDQQRGRFGAVAQKAGFDPNLVIGQPLYDAYRQAEENYIRQHGGTPRDPNAPQAVSQDVGDIGFNLPDANRSPFNPQQQAAYDAFLKANPQATPDQLNSFIHSIGLAGTIGNAKEVTGALRKTGQFVPGELAVNGDPRITALLQQLQQKNGAGDAAAVGAGQGTTLNSSDEIASAGAALKGALSGQGSFGDLYNVNETANQQYLNSLQQQHPIAYGAGELGGGAILAPVTFGASTPAQLAALSGAMGGIAGFNGGQGGIGNRVASAAEGGVAGSALGYAIPKGANLIFGRRAPEVPPLVDPQTGALNQPLEAMTPGQRVVHAEEYGINLPADAAGGATAARIGKGLDIMPGSAGVMEDARRATESQVAAASDVVASRFGSARTMNEAGSELQRGANEYIDRADATAGKLYNAIPIADNAATSLSNTRAALQELTGRFRSNPKLAAAMRDSKLDTYMEALTQKTDSVPTGLLDASGKPIMRAVTHSGELSWNDLKDFRSRVGEMIGDFRFGEGHSTTDLRALYGALSEDMRASAAAQGPKALAAFNRANTFYQQKEALIEDSLGRILGPENKTSPERAAAAVQAMTRGGKSSGDIRTLAQIRSATVKSGAWNEIASTLIRLGGQPANSAGRDFSPVTFVNWYADMSESARTMLFGGKANDLRKALDGFVAVNQRLEKVQALRNTSNTAGGLVAAHTATALSTPLVLAASGHIGPAIAAAAAFGGEMGTTYGMAKAWTNPGFVRWMTGYSKAVASGNAKAVSSQIGRISALAATNPDLREPLMALQQRLINAANDNIGKAAASPQNNQPNQ